MQSSDNQSAPQPPEEDLVAMVAVEDQPPAPPDVDDGNEAFMAEASVDDASDIPPDPPVQTDLGSEAEEASWEEAPDPPSEAEEDLQAEAGEAADPGDVPEPPAASETEVTTGDSADDSADPAPPEEDV